VLANVLRLLGRPGTILGLVALAVAAAGFAIAANPSRDGTVTACVNKKTRVMRLAKSNNRCKRTEFKLRFNQRGRQGLPGQNGAPGQPGANAATSYRDAKPGEVSTTSINAVALDGPSVTVDVPAGGATIVFAASFEGRVTGATLACGNFSEDGVPNIGLGCADSATYALRTNGGARFANAGPHTYSLRYSSTNASATAWFRNRVLSISVIP
jgi:hypothetical protein